MTVALDTSIGFNFGGTGSNGTITTAGANEVLVVVIGHEDHGNAQRTVSSVSDNHSLTWHKRSHALASADSNYSQCEVWWAAAATAQSYEITVAMTGNVDDGSVIVFAVSGADTSAPWDTSPVLPQINGGINGSSGGYQPQTAPLNTLNANCMLLSMAGGCMDPQGAFGGSWTQIAEQNNGGGALSSGARVYYQVVSSAEAALAVQSTTTNANAGWALVADAIVAASPAPGTAGLAVDGFTSSAFAGADSCNTIWLTTQGSDDLIFVAVCSDDGGTSPYAQVAISSITDSASAVSSWTQVKKFQFTGATGHPNSGIEIWCGKASGPLTADQITVTMAANVDGASVLAWGVNANGVTPIIDTNTNAIVTNSNGHGGSNNSPSWSGLSTTNATGLLFTVINSTQNGYTVPAGWVQANLAWGNVGNGDYGQLDVLPYSTARSSVSGAYSGLTDDNWGLVTFAVTFVGPPSGTWESTEGRDTFSSLGGILGGLWASTEVKDTFDAVSILNGLWESTDHKDAMAFFGYPELTGTWASTDAKDSFAGTGAVSAPLQLDGYATAGISEVSGDSYAAITTGAVTLSTTSANDVIVLAIAAGGFYSASQITSVTDAASLTWKRRNRAWQSGGNKYGDSSVINQGLDIEIWWAHAPAALTSDVITVNCTNGNGSMSLLAFGISGANYAAPWDSNTQAGGYVDQVGNNAYSPAMAQLSTNAAKAFLFGIHANSAADAGLTQSPFTYVTSVSASEHNGDGTFESLIYQIVSTKQVRTNLTFGTPYGSGYAFSAESVMFDSIVAFGETGTTDDIYWQWDAFSTSATLSLTTTNELVLNYSPTNYNVMALIQVLIQSASGTGEVSSISEGAGALTSPGFQRRSRVVNGDLSTEIWWGWIPTARPSNDTITINTTGTASGDVISAQMWGLVGSTGTYGLGDPFWDGNTSLPAENSASGDSPPPNAIDISTETPSCLAVAWTANITEPEVSYTSPFITLVQDAPNTVVPIMSFQSGGPPAYMGFEYMYAGNAALLSNETAEFLTSPEPAGWLMIADAIPVGPPQPPTGAWASTESRDELTHTGNYSEIGIVGNGGWVGFLPIPGTWHSTEHADEFTGAPAQAPYLGEGWLGWVPAHGTWQSTDKADAKDLYGWLIGFGGVTGQLGTVENPDRLAFSDYSTIAGTWRSTENKDRMAAAAILIPLVSIPPPAPVERRLLIIT